MSSSLHCYISFEKEPFLAVEGAYEISLWGGINGQAPYIAKSLLKKSLVFAV